MFTTIIALTALVLAAFALFHALRTRAQGDDDFEQAQRNFDVLHVQLRNLDSDNTKAFRAINDLRKGTHKRFVALDEKLSEAFDAVGADVDMLIERTDSLASGGLNMVSGCQLLTDVVENLQDRVESIEATGEVIFEQLNA